MVKEWKIFTVQKESSEKHLDAQLCEPISKADIRETLKMMTNGKVEGPD